MVRKISEITFERIRYLSCKAHKFENQLIIRINDTIDNNNNNYNNNDSNNCNNNSSSNSNNNKNSDNNNNNKL